LTKSRIENAVQTIFKELHYEFSNTRLLEEALTHKSFTNENLGTDEDNQRLEFLGDAVIGLVVAEALMERLPQATEGQLTPRRALLVKEASLAEMARGIHLGDLLLLGRGEEMNNGRDRPSILSDAVEAVVGAVYLDGGYDASRKLVLKWIGSQFALVSDTARPVDVKTFLQEVLQAKGVEMPCYEVIGEEGPDHEKIFEVEISVGKSVLARGRGRSKKEAEKDAARRALNEVEKP
jgi:ribonuclease-3